MHVSNLMTAAVAVLLLTSTACAEPRVEDIAVSSSGKKSGTLTIDGKVSELRHVYAFRTPYLEGAWEDQSRPSIQVILANNPVPDALLPQIEQALREGQRLSRLFSGLDRILNGTSLKLLVLSVRKTPKEDDGLVRYDPSICVDTFTAGADEPRRFSVFSVREGVVRGRASHSWTDSIYVMGPAAFEDRDVACAFDVEFEVTIGGTPLPYTGHPSVDPLPPLAAGKAEGTFRTEKGSVPLTTVYARRQKLFFDEPEDVILVTVTNRPLPKPGLTASLLDLASVLRENKLSGVRFNVSLYGTLTVSAPFEEGVVITNTNIFELSECRIEGDRLIGKVTYKHEKGRVDYSVTFDAPITAGSNGP